HDTDADAWYDQGRQFNSTARVKQASKTPTRRDRTTSVLARSAAPKVIAAPAERGALELGVPGSTGPTHTRKRSRSLRTRRVVAAARVVIPSRIAVRSRRTSASRPRLIRPRRS